MDKRVQHEALAQLEQPLVPVEQLQKSFRTARKYLERGDWSSTVSTLHELAVKGAAEETDVEALRQQAVAGLQSCIGKLQGLKRKIKEVQDEDKTQTKHLKLRLEHLGQLYAITSTDDDAYKQWTDVRLSRLLVDYVLRTGRHATADALIKSSAQLQDLTDADLFYTARTVEQSLRSRSCTECLAWCKENQSALRKNKSTLEFHLRVQEYVELVRKRQLSEAIVYARKHFAAWTETHLVEIQQVLALLAFPMTTACKRYQRYFEDARWERLIEQFHVDNYALNSLTTQPVLSILLQAGLTALKTPGCRQPADKNINCPACTEALGNLAERLPYSQRLNSCIVCRISGAIIDEDNPPMVLPNGNVYSWKALRDMADNNNGKIVDPRTHETFTMNDLKKAFLA